MTFFNIIQSGEVKHSKFTSVGLFGSTNSQKKNESINLGLFSDDRESVDSSESTESCDQSDSERHVMKSSKGSSAKETLIS